MSDVKKRRRIINFCLNLPYWKMAACILFNDYGRSGVPITWNFTRATLKTQTVNYFPFTVAMLQKGR
jgi:hypothetical protein